MGCISKSKNNLVGEYASFHPKFKNGKYTIGNRLKLNKDSSFNYESCGETVKGRWSLINDSVILFCYQFIYKNNNLNKLRSTYCANDIPYETFKIENNGDLESSFICKNQTIINHLTKVDEN